MSLMLKQNWILEILTSYYYLHSILSGVHVYQDLNFKKFDQ
jgi:hypothetical protein